MLGRTVDVTNVSVTRSIYSTSFPIDDVVIELGDGTELRLAHKNLEWDSLLDGARRTKPRFLYDPRREIGVYRDVLPGAPSGTAKLFAWGEWWLLLEKVQGVELFQVGDIELWSQAARWFASLHEEFLGDGRSILQAGVPLLVHDRDFYRTWKRRCLEFVRDERIEYVASVYEDAIPELVSMPQTFVHGEPYASNVLVADDRVCAIDWEMAAVGPRLVDLAALTAGKHWSDHDRRTLVEAYLGAPPTDEFSRELDICRLYLAVQWLGWSESWKPPEEHAHDWLDEAWHVARHLQGQE